MTKRILLLAALALALTGAGWTWDEGGANGAITIDATAPALTDDVPVTLVGFDKWRMEPMLEDGNPISYCGPNRDYYTAWFSAGHGYMEYMCHYTDWQNYYLNFRQCDGCTNYAYWAWWSPGNPSVYRWAWVPYCQFWQC